MQTRRLAASFELLTALYNCQSYARAKPRAIRLF